ncbi:hypothetical protein FKM82_030840 [Ascaphus truei]
MNLLCILTFFFLLASWRCYSLYTLQTPPSWPTPNITIHPGLLKILSLSMECWWRTLKTSTPTTAHSNGKHHKFTTCKLLPKFLLILLLSLEGDIEPNPGPPISNLSHAPLNSKKGYLSPI